jgi:hypothetical protein
MRKGFVLAAMFLMVTGFVAAGGNGIDNPREVEPGDSVTIPAEKAPDDAKEKPQRGEVVVLIETGNGKNVDIILTLDGDNTPIIKGSAIDRLDDRKQVNAIDPETVDDIQAGKADSARKEIAVKIQHEEGDGEKERGITINTQVVELAHSDKNQIGEEVSSISKRSARKGRNPQTGKEIKIPASADQHDEFDSEEKMVDEIRDEDDVSFEMREGRKGMNAVDVRRTD